MSKELEAVENIVKSTSHEPKTYLELLQKVGSQGTYQRRMLYLFSLVLLVSGSILIGSSSFFVNSQLECQDIDIVTRQCEGDTCFIDSSDNQELLRQKPELEKSLMAQFSPQLCKDQYALYLVTSSPYLGPFMGFFIFSSISDNIGRKKTMIISLSLTLLGSLILTLSQNVHMIIFGLIMAGAGINTSSNLAFYYLSEIIQNVKRQKYSIIIQIFYTFGAIQVITLNRYTQNWRLVVLLTQLIPLGLIILAFIFYAEETPQFLFNESNEKVLQALNRIGEINLKEKNILSQKDIQNVRKLSHHQTNENSQRFDVKMIDLFRIKSLRKITIICCLLSSSIFILYYGPIFIVNKIGFDSYVSSLVLQFSEIICFVPTYLLINRVERKKTSYYLFSIICLVSLALLFIQKPENCQNCPQSVIQLGLFFIFRFAVSCQYILFLVYVIELFPARVTGLGMGAISACGSLAITIGPIIISSFEKSELSVMILFILIGFIGLGLTTFLLQTKDKLIQTQIQEISIIRNQFKKCEAKSLSDEIGTQRDFEKQT